MKRSHALFFRTRTQIIANAVRCCALLVRHDRTLLRLAELTVFKGKRRAKQHLHHYLYGQGARLSISTEELLREDVGVCAYFSQRVAQAIPSGVDRGMISIPQWAFANRDWRYAMGSASITWTADGERIDATANTHYRWHPHARRITQRVHQAAHRLKQFGAREFAIVGEPMSCRLAELATAPMPPVPAYGKIYM